MLAVATALIATSQALSLGAGSSALHAVRVWPAASSARPLPQRSGMAVMSWQAALEMRSLKDMLMEQSVRDQLSQFNMMNDRGSSLWLKSAWEGFMRRRDVETPGQLVRFMDELYGSSTESVFVPSHTMRQGSANNPFLNQVAAGYHCEIEPSKVAVRIMACREQLAADWCEQLAVLASGLAHEHLPHEQRLAGLATRVAFRSMLHDLSLLPSQAGLRSYLATFVEVNGDALGPDGDVEGLLTSLEARPITIIFGSVLVDPPQIVEELRLMRQQVEEAMAAALEDTTAEHLLVKSSFLEACFKASTGTKDRGNDLSWGDSMPGLI